MTSCRLACRGREWAVRCDCSERCLPCYRRLCADHACKPQTSILRFAFPSRRWWAFGAWPPGSSWAARSSCTLWSWVQAEVRGEGGMLFCLLWAQGVVVPQLPRTRQAVHRCGTAATITAALSAIDGGSSSCCCWLSTRHFNHPPCWRSLPCRHADGGPAARHGCLPAVCAGAVTAAAWHAWGSWGQSEQLSCHSLPCESRPVL